MMTLPAFFMMKAASSAEPCLTGRVSAGAARGRCLAAEAAQDHRDEAAVHALAHDVGQDRARRADQRAGDDQRGVLQREADAGRRPAGIGIEHRHHDRHVGAADRNDQGDAEDEGQNGDRPERPERLIHRRNSTISPTIAPKIRRLSTWRAGSRIGAPDMLPLSLAKAMIEPAKVMAPMATPRLISIRLCVRIAPSRADAEGLRRIERRARDQHRGKTDQRMERRHQLRHLRHGDAARDHRADAAADGKAGDDQAPGQSRR